jgi:hypothetical protein
MMNEWQLAVKDVVIVWWESRYETKEPTALRPLLRATREIRARAMDLIPRLLDSIKDEATRLLAAIERAEAAANKL